MARDRPSPYGRRVPPPVGQDRLILTLLRSGDRNLQRGARGFVPRRRSRGEPSRMRVWHPRAPARWNLKRSRGTGPRATVPITVSLTVGRGPVPRHAALIEKSRGTGPRATVRRTAIFASSPHRTSSASDLPRKQDPATAASLMSPVAHQTPLPRSDSNTQYPASPMYP